MGLQFLRAMDSFTTKNAYSKKSVVLTIIMVSTSLPVSWSVCMIFACEQRARIVPLLAKYCLFLRNLE